MHDAIGMDQPRTPILQNTVFRLMMMMMMMMMMILALNV
jgi:hypothetical protein